MNSRNLFNFFHRSIVLSTVFIMLLVTNCDNRGSKYHFKIQYIKENKNTLTDKRNGIIAFNFLDYFQNDTVILNINNHRIIKEILNTHDVTGSAFLIEVDSLKNIDEVRITINNNDAYVKCDDENQLFVVTKKDKTILIRSVSYFKSSK